MLLKGKVAMVTGAASPNGIGMATARLFAEHGARVAVIDLESQGPAAAASAVGDGHRGYACDVSDGAQCHAAAEAVRRDLGAVDVLVNNAGIVQSQKLEEIRPEDWEAVIDTNLRGNFQMAQAVVPHMRERSAGAIVCVSSVAGQRGGGIFGTSHYAASKAGILGLAKALARELAPDGIRVNAVAPGTIDNDFTRGGMTAEIKARIAHDTPLGRLGTSEDVAKVCLFLASDLASYVTGAVIDVNGGQHIH
ncbi:MAG: SDR family oxidoreductase [Gammaproteobacteria bacterium]|nr:SDR family oxidoreductase [Gammaproteobacteria bacterium]NIR85905.1 SDR family oxidoreductase [Gammaproteobacteria bacterium]NIR91897.1 SDR family oxidoreductase [Gammaproteobacteria bacterium]NIU07154.1 SDR family oxidoreductase [Gammaproteobacteria bacterium]NIV53967.1 SDR family oxidoreductase [Gammaproteobacteria bacterium]